MSRVASWRSALAESVTPEDIATVVKTLVDSARDGERWAVRELLDRTVGKPSQELAIALDGVMRADTPQQQGLQFARYLHEHNPALAEQLCEALSAAETAAERADLNDDRRVRRGRAP